MKLNENSRNEIASWLFDCVIYINVWEVYQSWARGNGKLCVAFNWKFPEYILHNFTELLIKFLFIQVSLFVWLLLSLIFFSHGWWHPVFLCDSLSLLLDVWSTSTNCRLLSIGFFLFFKNERIHNSLKTQSVQMATWVFNWYVVFRESFQIESFSISFVHFVFNNGISWSTYWDYSICERF